MRRRSKPFPGRCRGGRYRRPRPRLRKERSPGYPCCPLLPVPLRWVRQARPRPSLRPRNGYVLRSDPVGDFRVWSQSFSQRQRRPVRGDGGAPPDLGLKEQIATVKSPNGTAPDSRYHRRSVSDRDEITHSQQETKSDKQSIILPLARSIDR